MKLKILAWTKPSWKDGISYNLINTGLFLTSDLKEDQKKYIYINEIFDLSEYIIAGKLNLFFGGTGNVDFLGVCIFLDKDKNKISPVFPKPNVFNSYDAPENARYIRLGVRIMGSGTYTFQQIVLGLDKNPNELNSFISRDNTLVLTNNYPSEGQLYKNMFVHQRVMAYKEGGVLCDVMEWNRNNNERYREFEGINIVSGQEDTLFDILENGRIQTVCVHFINNKMWEALRTFATNIRVIVWVHGAEIQPWWRRKCNYNTKEEEQYAQKESEKREKFWRQIFAERKKYNLHFVFVSQYFANEVSEDYEVKLEKEEYSIIHNCIDTDLFSYFPKDVEQRKKILSIRPYASNKYANDLTVKCIIELSKKDFFDELSFALYGDGKLFDEIIKPIKHFKNVKLIRKFLRQDEIAGLHKEYGIFLTPTRWDSQGVSRDEAMSSGLVAITNEISAIPEFADDESAILVPPEDYNAMAEGVERLYNNPEYFSKLSENARKRVERQTTKVHTIDKEIPLIQGKEIKG